MKLLDYIKKCGNKNFSQLPFCDADALVYSRLSYINWEMTVIDDDYESGKMVKIRDYASPKLCKEITTTDLSQKEATNFLMAVASSRRFKHIRVGYVKKRYSAKDQIQFCAMTFFNRDEEPVIAFRGTDTSLVGWKEDLSLAFKHTLLGQECALEYAEHIASIVDGKFKIVGHSKGGNLATYTLYTMSDEHFKKISAVYNLDGPGFLDPKSIFSDDKIKERNIVLKKFVPVDSLVGILLNQTSDYQVVESYKMLVSQHNPLNWKIDEKTYSLKCSKKRTTISKTFQMSTSKWVEETPPKDMDIATSYIIEFLGGYENNVLKILADIPGTYSKFTKKYSKESPEIQKLVKKTFLSLLIAARDVVFPVKMPRLFKKK